ncbi:MAG: sulfotransferase-like domain-containing protein [Salipiger thiooxidans]|uniref:sulfotransferase-like domain-containing protein n=1 Tax=Salipiger thiooxidans TaxID=282683 RepID=UPI001CFA1BE8|nr:HAD family hydrolase [Salipiger thiooxidans]
MRIAMWSGPRNLSTAMMYSFGNRADVHVVDEPFYGPYLRLTGLAHPMADEIMASRPESAEEVEQSLIGPIPDGRPHAYHKHMCQHMIPGVPRDFMADCVNVFLLRHPARVVASFSKGYENPTAADIGFAAQSELYDHVVSLGLTPYVIDSADIRTDPEGKLRALCDAIGLPFEPAMLAWPAGGHAQDGVWAPHWYASVHRSTGFAGPEGPLPDLDGAAADLAREAMPHYEKMRAHGLI